MAEWEDEVVDKTRLFDGHCVDPGGDDFIPSSATVSVDREGYFITVETCPYEGSAMFTLPVARKVLAALTEAIHRADEIRAQRDRVAG